ncbi:MAG: hypothetical protein KAI86_18750 [Desulfobacterales bacterium]|nr:hypothetical protein [Desulfobacterales bacterium]
MKNVLKIILGTIIVGLGLLLAMPVGATDYQSYSLEDLNAMRGNMATASPEERDAFRNARQEKMQSLSPDERLSYQTNSGKGGGSGNGSAIRARDGSGNGSMKRYGGSSTGGGMGSGGRQHRGGKR